MTTIFGILLVSFLLALIGLGALVIFGKRMDAHEEEERKQTAEEKSERALTRQRNWLNFLATEKGQEWLREAYAESDRRLQEQRRLEAEKARASAKEAEEKIRLTRELEAQNWAGNGI